MITQPVPFRLIYTVGLSGRVDLLGQMLTLLKRERAAASAKGGGFALVDLGLSCNPDSWICAATEGRAMLVAMDALGYDAFHIGKSDPLYARPDLVLQIREVIVTPLAAGPWHTSFSRAELIITLANAAQLPPIAADCDIALGLGLALTAETEIDLSDTPQRLVYVQHGYPTGDVAPFIGRLDLLLQPDAPYVDLVSYAQLQVTDDLFPDPTINGVLDFVESEAQQAEQRRRL